MAAHPRPSGVVLGEGKAAVTGARVAPTPLPGAEPTIRDPGPGLDPCLKRVRIHASPETGLARPLPAILRTQGT